MDQSLDGLVTQVTGLSPGRRRQFLRQMKARGLLETERMLSDREPLLRALSVPSKILDRLEKPVERSGLRKPPRPADRPFLTGQISTENGEAAGKGNLNSSETHSAGSNNPGNIAIEQICIVFDGGSRGNPGQGYGSFALDWTGNDREVVQLTFGDQVTNNEAEYDTLIAALEAVRDRLVEEGIDSGLASLSIRGDSLLVCNQVRGEWKCKEPRLQSRLKKVKALMSIFGSADLGHHPRKKSVEILGH